MEARMKDCIPFALASALLFSLPAVAQDNGAAAEKTRVTLYFEGSDPAPPARFQDTEPRPETDLQSVPTKPVEETIQRVEASSERTVRYLTPEEWANHPANRDPLPPPD